MATPKVLISILNWNAPANTIRTVQSVLLSEYDNYKILLLDNNSADDSVAVLKSSFPDIELIKTKTNLGYAGAHKIAAKIAVKENYDLLWILNNDVEVLVDSLGELVNAYARHGEAIFGSVILESDGVTINFGGGLEMSDEKAVNAGQAYNIFAGKNINEVQLKERPVSGAHGSSILIPVGVIKKYGFINTRFFLYGEETEYSYRLRKNFNVQTILVPASHIIHHGGGSFKSNEELNWIRAYYTTRNNNLVHHTYGNKNPEMQVTYKTLIKYIRYFGNHFFRVPKRNKDHKYWLKYYTELGNFHSMLRLKGKYMAPEKFINF